MQRQRENLARQRQTISHPRDRRVRQLSKKEKRNEKLEAQKARRRSEEALRVLRFCWFREQCLALGHTTTPVPARTVELLTRLYVDRNVDEVAALRAERNPQTGRIGKLEALREHELRQMHSAEGIAIPSLGDADDVEILTTVWDGAADTVSVVAATTLTLGAEEGEDEKESRRALAAKLRPIEELREARDVPLHPAMLGTRRRKTAKSGGSGGATNQSSAKSLTTARKDRRQARAAAAVASAKSRVKHNRKAQLSANREMDSNMDD